MSLVRLIAALLAQADAPPPAGPDAPAPAPQWETMFADSGSTYQIDPGSIARDGDTVTARVRSVAAAPSSDGLSALVSHRVFNCRRRTSVTVAMEGFTATGESLGRLEFPEDRRPPERTGSGPADRALFDRVCGPG